MKTIAKVFIIIGMVFGFWCIVPLLIGIFALQKLDTATNVADIRGWGIAVLFLVNFIAGIVMLTMTDEQLNEGRKAKYLPRELLQYADEAGECANREMMFARREASRKSRVAELEMYDEL